ncbi:hypothetical protein CMQ_2395 [Grosmannia clavigera kw1407]|uniref:Globin-sensor domain-containing protein n=1 Tax=Grosmannia clavigera (strain kw1407 / UAMH 11150) TaxID=655863 RepID=F0XJU9_GROCL|nr:uncharacterized protein CMQ_2395 [Grosmannia clavigera kw1407]EFX02346.1 hypothetical protein CMQ_2395 [Grosmannia clavigera kw1407]
MVGRVIDMRHIDRKELYTSLDARIQYLHSFLDFSSTDIDHLVAGAKYIKVLIPAVTNIVYRKLLQYDITARAFETRSTSFEGPLDAVPAEDSPQILHRKMFLRAYLARLCSDPSQMTFWEYLDKVGMMHVGLGRAHPLHVEYIHIGATLSLIQDVLTEAVLSHPRLSMGRKMGLVKALGKVIWIQNDLFAKWYVRDGEEYTDGVDYSKLIDREGFLHGQRILAADESEKSSERGDDDSEQGTERGETAALPADGVCPFASMAKTMAPSLKAAGSAIPVPVIVADPAPGTQK